MLPSAKHVGATDVVVGWTGDANIAALLKLAEATEVQLPLSAITV